MKVAMITPDSYMIDRRILLEAKTLVNTGHTVTLLAGFECKAEEHYYEDGIEIYRYQYDWDDERLKRIRRILPNNDKLKMAVNRAYMFLAKRVFDVSPFENYMLAKLMSFDADVIHVHDMPCLKVGYYAARAKNIPLIYDAHELYYAQDVLPKRLQKAYFELEKKFIKHPNEVITVNPFIAKIMSERYRVKEPNVIMNCTERPRDFGLDNNSTLLREKGNIPPDLRIVLYQGWISEERNLDTLVKGVKYFPQNVCLVMIGYGEYEKILKDIAKDEKVEDKIFFMGQVPSNEMLNYSVGADIGVIPYKPIDDNHLYCSPNKLFEYILAGVPVLSNDLPFFRMIKEKYDCIDTVSMDSPEEFGRKVSELIQNNEKLKTLKNNCIKAGEELNWDVEGKKLLKIYNGVISRNS